MPTNGEEIKGFIKDELELEENKKYFIMNENLEKLIECIAIGVYKGMQKLDDNTGTIPSVGHK